MLGRTGAIGAVSAAGCTVGSRDRARDPGATSANGDEKRATGNDTSTRRESDAVVWRRDDGDLVADHRSGTVGGDGSSDATVLNDLVTALAGPKPGGTANAARRNAYAEVLLQSDVRLDSTWDLTDLTGVTFRGLGNKFGATTIHVEHSGPMAIDLTNSRSVHFRQLMFNVPGSGEFTPDTILFFARDQSEESVSQHKFTDCFFRDNAGNTGAGLVYNYGSEVMYFTRCHWEPSSAVSEVITATNVADVSSPHKETADGKVSMLESRHRGCDYITGGADVPIVEIEGGGKHSWIQCFFGTAWEAPAFRLRSSGAFTTIEGLHVDASAFECLLLDAEKPRGGNHVLQNVSIDRSRIHADSQTPPPYVDLTATGPADERVIAENLALGAGNTWIDAGTIAYEIAATHLRAPDLWLQQGADPIVLRSSDTISGGRIVSPDASALPPDSAFLAPHTDLWVDGMRHTVPRGTAPENPRAGTWTMQNGGSWNPTGSGAVEPVYFDGDSWVSW
jgi:hypothetical protein